MRNCPPVNFSENSRQLAATANGIILEGLVDLLKYERDVALALTSTMAVSTCYHYPLFELITLSVSNIM